MRVATLLLALSLPGLLPGQQVRGRVVGGDDHHPLSRALVELRQPSTGFSARTVTTPSGAFVIQAPAIGRYTLRVAAIGYSPQQLPLFDVQGDVRLVDVAMQPAVVTLRDLQVLGDAGKCGSLGGESSVLTRLLDGARTSLDVMAATLEGSGGFRIEAVHRTALAGRGDSIITADTTRGAMVAWPIQAVDPDSLRRVGFMAEGLVNFQQGRVWYGPDVSVLSADWFLQSHCFHLATGPQDSTGIRLVFEPAKKGKLVDIAGTMLLDPKTLALKRLTFEHRNLPDHLRNGVAGGELTFAPLPSGLWLPMTWRIFAPIQSDRTGRAMGIDERDGRLLSAQPGGVSSRSPPTGTGMTRPLVFTIPRATLAPPDSLTDISHLHDALAAGCPDRSGLDRTSLLAEERVLAARDAKAGALASDWLDLGCTRALLDLDGAIAREGLQMPLGTSWQTGATRSLLSALELDHRSSRAAEVLAVVALDQAEPKEGRAVRDALARAVTGGVTAPAAVRGCALLSLRMGELAASNRCTIIGLEAGGDSTWQLLHLARLASRSADTATVASLLDAAMAAAHQPSDWAEVGWQLRWFLEPGEWEAWQEIPDSVRGPFVRDELARRDIRDGRRPGSRLVKHFNRLDYAEEHFLRDMPRKQRGRMALAAVPEADPIGRPSDPDDIRFTALPESIAAQPYRFFRPWSPWFDDRGAVWLRFGKPDKSVFWKDARGGYNTRAVWLYDYGDRRIILNFEGESFDGSPEPNRLVAGVLGHYLCSIDNARCQLTMRLSCWDLPGGCDPSNPQWSPISPERLETLRTEDKADIAIATTTDDNAVRVSHPITTEAHLSRVWDPATGAPLAVIPYAFRAGDLVLTPDSTGVSAEFELTLRQWSRATETWLATSITRRLHYRGTPDDKSWLTSFVVIPSTPDVSAWSLVAVQDTAHRGRAWADSLVLIGDGAFRLSDLVLGAASQGHAWPTTTGGHVALAPLGAFSRTEPVSVYWQVRTRAVHDSVRTTVALHKVGVRREEPAFEVAFGGRLGAGLNEVQREIGVDRLDAGAYRIELVVRDLLTGAEARRSARLLLR